MFLELTKDGDVVDSALRLPSKTGATMSDKTYFYKKDIGNQKGLVIIAVHFKDAVTIGSQTAAVVDGIWQISETATEVRVDTEYGKMRIASVSSDTILMDNKDNSITLSKNKEIPLMGNIRIRTSDQDVVDDANPLRYYIYTEEICECG
jgi:hypothetical protein